MLPLQCGNAHLLQIKLRHYLNVAIEDAIEFLSYDSETVQMVHHSDPAAIELARKGQLQQVFVNIVQNASQAMRKDTAGQSTVITPRLPYTTASTIAGPTCCLST